MRVLVLYPSPLTASQLRLSCTILPFSDDKKYCFSRNNMLRVHYVIGIDINRPHLLHFYQQIKSILCLMPSVNAFYVHLQPVLRLE